MFAPFRKIFIVICCCVSYSVAYSQADSTEVDDDATDTTIRIVRLNTIMPHKRGVYKTYEEYLGNSPSVDAEFTLTPLQISKKNPLVAEGDVDYKGKRPKKIWGVSDGEFVYVRVMVGQFLKNHYFRLQCDGPSPFIYLVEKPVVVAGGFGLAAMAGIAAGSAALPPFVSLYIVKDETDYRKPVKLATNSRMKKYLQEYPDLLAAYEKEHDHNKATKVKYLSAYNKRKAGS